MTSVARDTQFLAQWIVVRGAVVSLIFCCLIGLFSAATTLHLRF